ncbi:MAG: hypothetical protein WBA25_10200 [Jannaschia sp.]
MDGPVPTALPGWTYRRRKTYGQNVASLDRAAPRAAGWTPGETALPPFRAPALCPTAIRTDARSGVAVAVALMWAMDAPPDRPARD